MGKFVADGVFFAELNEFLQRAKVMKFSDGYMISTGEPKKLFVETCSRNVMMRQGVLGVKVKILKPHDPEGKCGPAKPMPDFVVVHDPKEDPVLPENRPQ